MLSNVVKQTDNLLNDHTMGCEKLQKINEVLRKDLIQLEIISSTVRTASSKKKQEQLKNMKGSIVSSENLNVFPDGQRLYTLVTELEKLSDAQKTRLDLAEEEATHFKQSYHNINKEYNRIKVQFEQLAQKLSQQDEQKKEDTKPPRSTKMFSSFKLEQDLIS